jgi:hypothetical protein
MSVVGRHSSRMAGRAAFDDLQPLVGFVVDAAFGLPDLTESPKF